MSENTYFRHFASFLRSLAETLRERRSTKETQRLHPLAINADEFRLVDLATENFDVVEQLHGYRRIIFLP